MIGTYVVRDKQNATVNHLAVTLFHLYQWQATGPTGKTLVHVGTFTAHGRNVSDEKCISAAVEQIGEA